VGVIVQKLVKDTGMEDMVARLGRAPGGVYVSIGTPKEVAFAKADRILARNLTRLVLAVSKRLAGGTVAPQAALLRHRRHCCATGG